jgi:hypothetical protein
MVNGARLLPALALWESHHVPRTGVLPLLQPLGQDLGHGAPPVEHGSDHRGFEIRVRGGSGIGR